MFEFLFKWFKRKPKVIKPTQEQEKRKPYKANRPVSKVFIHCSASDNLEHDDVSVIKRWHVEDRGWSDVGYHFFIKFNGDVQVGRPLTKIPAAQVQHNTGSIAICLAGLDKFTKMQFDSLKQLCKDFNEDFNVTFHGHCEVSTKACPNFDYKSILKLDNNGVLGI